LLAITPQLFVQLFQVLRLRNRHCRGGMRLPPALKNRVNACNRDLSPIETIA
jgi:hypothetical protein